MPLWSIPEIGTGKFLPHSLSLSFSVFSLVCLSVLVVAQSVIFCRYTSLQHHLYRLSEKKAEAVFFSRSFPSQFIVSHSCDFVLGQAAGLTPYSQTNTVQ